MRVQDMTLAELNAHWVGCHVCKNCTYWERNEDGFGGKCKSGKIVYTEDMYDNGSYKKYDDDMVEYGDSESYSAYCDTGPEFGCRHFKQKGALDEEPGR
jgi:hypothetical protein